MGQHIEKADVKSTVYLRIGGYFDDFWLADLKKGWD